MKNTEKKLHCLHIQANAESAQLDWECHPPTHKAGRGIQALQVPSSQVEI